jgi:protocatechuate 3,4-dioxygenase beta subunit
MGHARPIGRSEGEVAWFLCKEWPSNGVQIILIAPTARFGKNVTMNIGGKSGSKSDRAMNRRAALGALSSVAAVFVVGCGDGSEEESSGEGSALTSGAPRTLSCVATPDQTEGPFFVDEKLLRSDLVAADPNEPGVQRGVPLLLKLGVFTVSGNRCTPLANATVDIWHSDASGIYSDEFQPTYQQQDTRGKRYLRGYQLTDASGQVQFKTIYPGAYPARTIHIHFKIRTYSPDGNVTSEFTSQVYFDDRLSDQISYNAHRRVRNSGDDIFADHGSELMLNVVRDGDGYVGTFNIGLRG